MANCRSVKMLTKILFQNCSSIVINQNSTVIPYILILPQHGKKKTFERIIYILIFYPSLIELISN